MKNPTLDGESRAAQKTSSTLQALCACGHAKLTHSMLTGGCDGNAIGPCGCKHYRVPRPPRERGRATEEAMARAKLQAPPCPGCGSALFLESTKKPAQLDMYAANAVVVKCLHCTVRFAALLTLTEMTAPVGKQATLSITRDIDGPVTIGRKP